MVETLQDLVGLTYDTDIDQQEILRLAETENVRIYSTQMMVTADFKPKRLNVIYDHTTKKIQTVDYG